VWQYYHSAVGMNRAVIIIRNWVSCIIITLYIYVCVCVCVCVCVLCINVHIPYIQYLYILQVHMSTSGITIRYIGWGYQSPNPRKYSALNGSFVFDLRDVFQERNSGVQRDLPVYLFMYRCYGCEEAMGLVTGKRTCALCVNSVSYKQDDW
jgi:hypothetical protein